MSSTPTPADSTPDSQPDAQLDIQPPSPAEPAAEATTTAADAPAQDAVAVAGPVAALPAMSPAECAQRLKQLFPGLFAGQPKPLKLRIQADIQARAPGVFSKQVLSAFLRRLTGSTSYLIALTRASHRYDLDGQPGDELLAEHRLAAQEELARRRELSESRRAVEDEQRHNRATLLRDFQQTTLTPANFCALKGLPVDELEGLLEIARREAAEAPRPGGPGFSPPGAGRRGAERVPGERPRHERPDRGGERRPGPRRASGPR
jgi:hypothetical protein